MASASDSSAAGGTKFEPAQRGLPYWVKVAAILLGVPALLLGISILYHSEFVVDSTHKRNFHIVNIAAHGIETWPRDIQSMARSSYLAGLDDKQIKIAQHPDIGRYIIHFYAPDPQQRACVDMEGQILKANALSIGYEEGTHPGQGLRFVVSGTISKSVDRNSSAQVNGPDQCFIVRVPLARLINTSIDGAEISNFLITDDRGKIVAQVGDTPLTVDSIDGFLPTDTVRRGIFEEIGLAENAKPQGQSEGSANGKIGRISDVASLRLGGEDYLAYFKPFVVANAVSLPCRAGQAAASGKAAADSARAGAATSSGNTSADVAAAKAGSCYIVALMPRASLTARWLGTMPLQRTEMTLAVLFLAVLLPFLRFVLNGPAESSSPAEILAVLFGLPVAVVIALYGVLFAADVMAARNRAAEEVAETADQIAVEAGKRIAERLQKLNGLLLDTRKAAGTAGEQFPERDCSLFDNVILLGRAGENPDPDKGSKYDEATKYTAGAKDAQLCPVNLERSAIIDVSGREYFQLARDSTGLLRQDHLGFEYAIAGVRSQLEGFDTAVISARFEPIKTVRGERNFAVATFQLPSFSAAVTPRPVHYMVVDTAGWAGADRRLPVIFHYQRGHTGLEYFAGQADPGEEVIDRLVQLGQTEQCGGTECRVGFETRYDGQRAIFAARHVPHSRWVLLTWQHLTDSDTLAQSTIMLSLWGYLAFALLALGLPLAGLLVYRRLAPRFGRKTDFRWSHLWPHEEGREAYAVAARAAFGTIAAAAVLCELLAYSSGMFGPAFLTAFVAIAACVVGLTLYLGKIADTPEPLSVLTERRYLSVLTALIALVAIFPAVIVWEDARAFTLGQNDVVRLRSVNADIARTTLQSERIQNSLKPAPDSRQTARAPEQHWFLPKPRSVPLPAKAVLAPVVWQMQNKLVPEPGPGEPSPCRSACKVSLAHYPIPWDFEWSQLVAILVLGFLPLLALIWWLPRRLCQTLFGFGVPLLAIKDQSDAFPSGSRILIVGGDHPARDRLMKQAEAGYASQVCERIDLAEEVFYKDEADLVSSKVKADADAKLAGRELVQFYGLSLLLRDEVRRQAALVYLEQAERAMLSGQIEKIVVYSDLTPLERILEVVDAERSDPTDLTHKREELRWARFFQNFRTVTPPDTPHPASPDMADASPPLVISPTLREVVTALISELRPLPVHILQTLLPDGVHLPDSDALSEKDKPFVDWVEQYRLPTVPAAIDYLRVNLIEYYEQLWFASTQAERVALDAIARGNFLNMQASLVLRSLVRRRLVTLEPMPHPFNESFAMFVRQAERPETIRSWREKQPKGNWSIARWPLLIGVPAGLLLVAYAAAQQGESVGAIASALLAGVPMLIGILARKATAT